MCDSVRLLFFFFFALSSESLASRGSEIYRQRFLSVRPGMGK